MVRVPVASSLLFALAWFASPALAQDEAAFDQGYAAVRDLMQKGKWPEAKKALTTLLEQNQGKLYVLAEKPTIVADHKQCSFWCATKVPKPESLLSGKIDNYNPGSSRIRVRYSKDDMSDWREVKPDVYLHPMVFQGNYTVTITDKSYPEQGVSLLFDFDGPIHHRASFGGGKDKIGVRRMDGDKELSAENKDGTPPRVGAPFVAQLKVDKTNVELLVDKKSLLKIKRDKYESGQVALAGGPYDEVMLEGDMEPSWFQNAVDDFLAAQRETFYDEYRAEQELPAWLFAELKIEAPTAKHDFEGKHAKSEKGEEFFALLEKNDLAAALELIGKLGDEDISKQDRTYLTALVHQRRGDAEAALPIITAALDAAPEVTYLRVLKAEVLNDLHREREALPLLQKAWNDDPGNEPALQALFVALLRSSDVVGAEHLVRQAKVSRGMWSASYDLDRMLAMRRRGPAWPRHFVQTSAHYEVHSDIDAKVCADACKTLEESYAGLQAQFVAVKEEKDAPRFQVFLFSGESGYQEYNDSILGRAVPHSAGLYSPVLKQLLIWNVPKREDMVITIRHEGFHQFLDRVMQNPPVWFNEGMAEFWETARREGDKFVGGQPRPQHVTTLQRAKKDIPKLKVFVYGGRGDFYANAQQRYAQGWALVHFLRKGPAANQKTFQTLWEALRTKDCSSKSALDKAFAGVDWDKLDSELWAWIDKMAATK